MRLGIGTAQFGLEYGISNTVGRVSVEEVRRILTRANELGIEDIDTAAAYGDSEAALGAAMDERSVFRIVTKTGVISPAEVDASAVQRIVETFRRSLERLRRPSVYALLVHRAADLIGDGAKLLWAGLEKLKENGLCQRIGVSVYGVEELQKIRERFPVDIVQVAVNVFDQRWPQSGWLKRLRDAGVEIHARSIFLQGLLLMDHQSLPSYFAPWKREFSAYAAFRQRKSWNPLEAALKFIRAIQEIDCVVLGVHSLSHIEEIHAAWCRAAGEQEEHFGALAVTDEGLLNPALWKVAPVH